MCIADFGEFLTTTSSSISSVVVYSSLDASVGGGSATVSHLHSFSSTSVDAGDILRPRLLSSPVFTGSFLLGPLP